MVYDAKLGTQTFTEKVVVDGTHPAIILAMKIKPNQGELKAGLIVALDTNGEVVPYNPTGQAPLNIPIGVLTVSIDTTKETVGSVLRHGTVVRKNLLVGNNPVAETDIQKLADKGIFAL